MILEVGFASLATCGTVWHDLAHNDHSFFFHTLPVMAICLAGLFALLHLLLSSLPLFGKG